MQPFNQSLASQSNRRNPIFRPFASDSIWNHPIGDEARYLPTNFQPAYLSTDKDHLFVTRASDPIRNVFRIGDWRSRASGTEDSGIDVPLPDGLIIPDANEIERPNNSSAFLLPDGNTFLQLNATARVRTDGKLFGVKYPFWPYPEQTLDGEGTLGAHGGSGLSSIGGSIRIGELTRDAPIQHALKLNLWAKEYLSYSRNVNGQRGYRWPAIKADGYANFSTYGGNLNALRMGSLLAIPPSVTPGTLGLDTEPARKIFYALQNYGGYVVDDTAWEAHSVGIEAGVLQEFEYAYGYSFEGTSGSFYDDMMAIFGALNVVTNNGPNRIGGGGDPLVPFSPNLDMGYVTEVQSVLNNPDIEDQFEGDFDGDGNQDLFWRNIGSGANQVWKRDRQGRIIGGGHTLPVASWDWQVKQVSDIDRDGRDELLWENLKTNEQGIWHLDDVRRWRDPRTGKRTGRWLSNAGGTPRIETFSEPTEASNPNTRIGQLQGQYRRYEAESLNLTNYNLLNLPSSGASKGTLVSLNRTAGTGTIAGTFDGPVGQYMVNLKYFDESDGIANLTVTVAGNTQRFSLDKLLSDSGPSPLSYTQRVTHPSITLRPGDTFRIVGEVGGGDFARVDTIAFIPLRGQNAPSGAALPSNAGANANADVDQEVLALTNQFRTANGLDPLTLDNRLDRAAQKHSDRMVQDDFLGHVGVNNSTPLMRAEAEGYDVWAIAENIGAGYSSPESIVESWKQSPEHRANLLNPAYESMGVGYTFGGIDTSSDALNHYWTQVLGVEGT